MRVETNDHLVKRNRKIATYMFVFSLAVLIFGFFAANGIFFKLDASDPENGSLYLVIMPLVLMVGLISTITSVRMTNIWIRQPRPEVAIREGLKGISNKSVLYNYLFMPARHVLICPQGVFAIITRFQDGSFSVDGARWRTHRSFIGAAFSIFRVDGIGNPTAEALAAAQHVQEIMDDLEIEVTVQPLIIFADPRAKIEFGETAPPVPVLYADAKLEPNLKDYLRDVPADDRVSLTPEQIKEFEEDTIEYV
jgi:hypothetical protein